MYIDTYIGKVLASIYLYIYIYTSVYIYLYIYIHLYIYIYNQSDSRLEPNNKHIAIAMFETPWPSLARYA